MALSEANRVSAVLVVRSGLLTTVQDRGRWGLQSRGVPVAGAMDPCSHRLANALVGNGPDAATLEVTLVGPELEFDDEHLVAVAGAGFELSVDGRSVPATTAFLVGAGGRLQFGKRLRGARAYVGIAGGIAVPAIFGSRATHLMSAMGGMEGRAIRAGDRLPLGEPVSRPSWRTQPRLPIVALPNGYAELRVLPGPQQEYFAPEALETLLAGPYTVGRKSDRMGYRLEGPRLARARGADIISDATPFGALQVPASGEPILLMADRQTTGGYPKIATVITADLSVAGQLKPGDQVSFVTCSLKEALAALVVQERALMAVEALVVP